MLRNQRSKTGNRRPAGKLDILIITLIALLLIAGFVYVIFQIVGHSEEHVDTVRKTKVIYKESLRWRPDSDLCETRITQDLIKFPNRKEGIYNDLSVNEKSVKLISQMSKIEKLDLDRSTVKDRWLEYLVRMPVLTNLSLEGCPLTDRAIPYILRMEKLNRLSIGDTEITDEGMEMLSAHRSLTTVLLNICRCVTNDGIKNLAKLKHLRSLEICNSVSLTGKCIPNLKEAKELYALNLDSLSVTTDDMKNLATMKRLTHLDLSNCALKDQDMAEIAKMTGLRHLDLTSNYMTGDGLMLLTTLKKLTVLRVKGCPSLNEASLAKFRSAMPRCGVHYSPATDLSEKMSRKDVKQSVDFLKDEVRIELEKGKKEEDTLFER